ncbi:unnamed protein product [Leptosia nina]|uniref:Thyroglobulin type-1 domain-containing protein n=1 Tax=Leptosia nina TaxID=320188 RepID=A0AAV1K6Z1_9NEOP
MNKFILFLTVICANLLADVFSTNTKSCDIAQTCITDLSDCGLGFTLTRNTHIFGCCPGCTQDAPGDDGDLEEVFFDDECVPPANCLPDGSFGPVQCKGDRFTGRCFCSDKKGQRLFGQMWRSDANEMTCACSTARKELEDAGHVVTLHCTANGDYEPLQCNQGMCWCVEPKTGQPTVIPIPEEDMKLLPCYSGPAVGEQYLRRCESIVSSLSRIYKEQSEHGTRFYGNPTTVCDYDGSYGAYQIENGIAYCTGRDGKILGSWQAIVSEMNNMNCNCARDSRIHFPARGMSVAEVCQPNGNYRPNQIANGAVYCVDSDGYTIERRRWPQICVEADRANNGTLTTRRP